MRSSQQERPRRKRRRAEQLGGLPYWKRGSSELPPALSSSKALTLRTAGSLIASAGSTKPQQPSRRWRGSSSRLKDWEQTTKAPRLDMLERVVFPHIGKLPVRESLHKSV